MRSPFPSADLGTHGSVFNTLLASTLLIACVLANVEKVIFQGPPSVPIPPEHPNLQDLHLDILTPTRSLFRTWLPAAFPDDELPKGKESWFVLEGLKEGQRYEVRVCWAAIVRFIRSPGLDIFLISTLIVYLRRERYIHTLYLNVSHFSQQLNLSYGLNRVRLGLRPETKSMSSNLPTLKSIHIQFRRFLIRPH